MWVNISLDLLHYLNCSCFPPVSNFLALAGSSHDVAQVPVPGPSNLGQSITNDRLPILIRSSSLFSVNDPANFEANLPPVQETPMFLDENLGESKHRLASCIMISRTQLTPFQMLKCIVLHLTTIKMTTSKLYTTRIVESKTKSSAWKTIAAVFHDLPISQLKKTPGHLSEHALILRSQSWFSPHTWTTIKPQSFSSFFTKL